ncbi:MAG: Glyoxalase/bleomycin resistance protein/dioxygenase [Ilumatobacteraceae bacterium]|nr:Glyoxalase/bleomycin resistance protein/dioxygenase [Ilumatobacteraceae bacterium]
MEMTSYQPGTPSWVDIGVPDMDAAMAFYGGLFGWTFTEGSAEAGGYRNALIGDKRIAGFGPQMNPGPPFWSTYVATASADDTAAKVVAAGGQVIVAPMDVLDVGRMAVFTDDTGTFFSCWQAGTHPGAERVNEPGTLCWNELNTRNAEEAKAFYGAVFGWTSETSESPMMTYTQWYDDGRILGGMLHMGPQFPPQIPNNWLVYFAVEDTDAALAKVTELGGSVMMPPMDIPTGRFAVVGDNAGAPFAIIKLATDAG